MSKATDSTKSASERQREYINRQRERGLVLLTGMWVPKEHLELVRTKIKELISTLTQPRF